MPRKISARMMPDHQRLLLEVPRHLQGAHQDDEDEQVVDREAVLRQPAGEELHAEVMAVGGAVVEEDPDAERDRRADVDAERDRALLERRLVRVAGDDDDVEEQHGDVTAMVMPHSRVLTSTWTPADKGLADCQRSLPPPWVTRGPGRPPPSGRPTDVLTRLRRRNTPLLHWPSCHADPRGRTFGPRSPRGTDGAGRRTGSLRAGGGRRDLGPAPTLLVSQRLGQ